MANEWVLLLTINQCFRPFQFQRQNLLELFPGKMLLSAVTDVEHVNGLLLN